MFTRLAEQLPDSYSVFYSAAWLGVGRDGVPKDGEADFVVAHRDHPLLVLEVKGGRVGRREGDWVSIDREGKEHRIKDPLRQARENMYGLLDKVKALPGTTRFVHCGYGAVLPGSARRSMTGLGADAPPELLAFAEDLPLLGARIDALFEHWSGDVKGPGIGPGTMSALERLLAPTLTFKAASAELVAADERELMRLTSEQLHVLTMLQRQRRVVIRGGAGTGKTVLARDKARRLAEEGFRTLLTCFNRPLADHLRREAGDHQPSLTIETFHQFCSRLAKLAGLATGRVEDLPELLLPALDALPDQRFDAIIVDEAQDFEPDWWAALELALDDPESGVLYAFLDDNQRLYAVDKIAAALPKAMSDLQLTQNLRNTKAIHRLAARFYSGAELEAVGPDGLPVEWVACEPGRLLKELGGLLHRLVGDGGAKPSDIAVLTGRSVQHSALRDVTRIGNLQLGSGPEASDTCVLLESIWRFKGLERPIVVLVDIDRALKTEELLYVGLSRARALLAVVAADDTIGALKGLTRDAHALGDRLND